MRKILFPILFLFVLLASCKKNSDDTPVDNNTDTLRVQKVQYSSSDGMYSAKVFTYDLLGRITSMADSSHASQPYVTVVYTGNEAILTNIVFNSGTGYSVETRRYKLNDSYQPVQRIQYDTSYLYNGGAPQIIVKKDTCTFEYDASGLLTKATGAHYDSLWHNVMNAYFDVTVNRQTYISNYTNNAGMLMHLKTVSITEVSNSILFTTTTTTPVPTISHRLTEENYSFEYNNHYSNKSDFVNAWVMAEVNLMYSSNSLFTRAYKYYPDKGAYSTVTTDATNGQVLSNSSQTWSSSLEYNPSGYISSITDTINQGWYKYRFIYNQ